MRNVSRISRILRERFGDPIGSYAGEPLIGVRDEASDVCSSCGMMPIDGECGCEAQVCDCGKPVEQCECSGHMHEGVEPCSECGMLEVDESCGCTHNESEED